MSIKYDYEIQGKLLKVITGGFDENFNEALEYGRAIVSLANEHNISYLMCDERNLKYNLTIPETFNLVSDMLNSVPVGIKIAIVSNEANEDAGKFFSSVAANRGAFIEFFTDITLAEKWLESD